MKSNVYFTKDISPDSLVRIYEKLGFEAKGNVGVKLHSGEKGNQNFLRPDFFKKIIDKVNGTVVECNTAYPGARNTTEKHLKLLEEHGWTKSFKCVIADADGELELKIPNGKILKSDFVGKKLEEFDSLLVLSHFKGHPSGGYGGALKQLSIGCASSAGKALIHSAGVVNNPRILWNNIAEQNKFLESMADAAYAVHNYFKDNICYITVICNVSVDCDCVAKAEDPCMKDIGIVASYDPVAIDQACIDLLYSQTDDPGLEHFKERVESRNGRHTIDAASELGLGNKEYNLIDIDK